MRGRLTFALLLFTGTVVPAALAADSSPASKPTWQLDTPIVTYWAGPPMTDTVAQQMADGGWNLVWCTEKELDVAQRHGLRALLRNGLLSPASLDDPAKRKELDALIARVRNHPALYSYFITDEPSAGEFPALGKSVCTLVGPRDLEVFDAASGTWSPVGSRKTKLQLVPGGGKLVRAVQGL